MGGLLIWVVSGSVGVGFLWLGSASTHAVIVTVCVEKRRWWLGLKWVDWLWHCDWEKKRCDGGGNGGGRREVAEEEVFSFGYKRE